MLNRRDVKLIVRIFTVKMEVEPTLSVDMLENKICDGLSWVEGVGKVKVVDDDWYPMKEEK